MSRCVISYIGDSKNLLPFLKELQDKYGKEATVKEIAEANRRK